VSRPDHIVKTLDEIDARVEALDEERQELLDLGDRLRKLYCAEPVASRPQAKKAKKKPAHNKRTKKKPSKCKRTEEAEEPAARQALSDAKLAVLRALEDGALSRDELGQTVFPRQWPARSGPLSKTLNSLETADLVVQDDGFVRLTDAGEAALLDAGA